MDLHTENRKFICRLCLQPSDDVVNIWNTFEDSTIASILVKHFWFQIHKNDGLTESLCQMCWLQTKTFHQFYQKIEEFQKCFLDSVDSVTKDIIGERAAIEIGRTHEAQESHSNEIKCGETELISAVINTQINEEESSDDDNISDEWEADKTFGEEDLDNEQQKNDDGVMTRTVRRVKRKYGLSPSEKIELDGQIREMFNMKCEICNDVEFETLLKAKQHYREVHETQGYITCCGRKFTGRYEIVNHIRRHTNPDTLQLDRQIRELFNMKCEICNDVEFETLLKAKQHYREVHETQGYITCCGRKFTARYEIVNHIRRHTNPDTLQFDRQVRELFNMKCEICSDVEFETLTFARRHYRTVHQKKGYIKCSHQGCCDRKFVRRFEILAHIRYHSDPNAYRCTQCNKKFRDKNGLKSHMDNHVPLDSREFKCNLCPSSFAKAYTLKNHIEVKHTSKTGEKFPCDKCGKNFRSSLLLTCHIRQVHQTTFEHMCEVCARRFKNKTALQHHISHEHSTAPPPKLQCDICKVWLKDLRGHLALHKEDMETLHPVKCPFCSKEVLTKRLLDNHISYVHGEKRHPCTLCDKKLKSAKNLKEHIATHTGEDLYKCSYCEKKFKSNGNMYNHRKIAHVEEWTRDCLQRRKPTNIFATASIASKTSES